MIIAALTIQCMMNVACWEPVCKAHLQEHLSPECISGASCSPNDYEISDLDEFCGRRLRERKRG